MKLKIKIFFVFIATVALVYIVLGLAPYMGRPYVSAETRAAFAIQNFFCEHESPERVLLLEAPRDSFFHRVNLISNAREQILFTTFSLHDGAAGDIIVGALLAAADRGVHVQFVYNAIGGFVPSRYRRALSGHENIDVFSFGRWQFFNPQYLNTALHDKYMVVDGRAMILGGRNISDRYFDPDGFTGNLTFDREVLVYNADPEFRGSIADAIDYFNIKMQSQRMHLHNHRPASGWEQQRDMHIGLYLAYLESLDSTGFDYYTNTTRVNRITLITNPIDSTKNDSAVAYNLKRLALNSEVIVAQSPYVAFTNKNMRLLTEVAAGRDFTLSTNSLAAAVNIPSFSSYYFSRRRLVDAGIHIYEFQSTDSSLHGKTYLFDGRLTAIGSFNMNERSIRADTESMLIIDSEEFHGIVLDAINEHIAQSLMVAADLSYVPCDYVEEAHVPRMKRALYVAAGYVLRVFRFMF